jgi:hypothetical protein
MNRRLALGLAAYLALWAAIAGGIIYGIIWAGYPGWVAVVSVCLLFIFVNGSLAYRARVRQLRLEGKEPPPYLGFLFFPQGLPKFKEQAPRAEHFFVGIAAAVAGLFFVFCGVALAFSAQWSRISQPIMAVGICAVLAGIGGLFLYFAWRCLRFRGSPPTNVA